jgi:addiction module RelE/StbE family toxin
MRIIVREEAADDLDALFEWVARDNPSAAVELLHRIRERIERLATPGLSHMGRFGAVRGTRELVEPPYIIVYQVEERRNEIAVLAVFHASQSRG